jgi:hypothetical protein
VAINAASVLPALKNYYTPTRVETMTQKDFPFMAMVRKRTNLVSSISGGRPFVNVMIAGNGASGSSDFVTSQNNSQFPPLAGFQIFSTKDYATPTIDAAAIEASGNNTGAFFQVLKESIDSALRESAQAQALNMMGDGTGIRGTVAVVTGTTQVTLTDVAQNVNFQGAVNGQGGTYVQAAYVSAGAWALRANQAQCTGVDPTTGVLTFSGGLPTSTAVGDILVRAGDLPAGTPYNNGCGTTSGARYAGLAGYIPLKKPVPGTNDSFGSIDRSSNPWKFAGGRFDGTGKSATDAINLALGAVRSQGGHPNILLCNEFTWSMIESDLEGRRNIVSMEKIQGAGTIGFDSLRVQTPKGVLNIVADNSFPSNIGYLIQLDTWTMWSMNGPHVRILDYPGYGQANVPAAALDALQIRTGTRGALLECAAPAFNSVIQFK